ncbi:MAG: NADH-quinone oxidoreductase subunit H [Gaiellales bacterium]
MRATTVAGQLVGAFLLAPLLPGLVQQLKARFQGRRGPSPLQPYRELRRLWGKSAIAVEGTGPVYRFAPAAACAAVAVALLLVPIAAETPELAFGHDALALAGILALSRFALAAAAWDTRNGFALQGVARDLTLSVAVDVTLVLGLATAALVAGSTDLRAMIAGTAGSGPWTSPALVLGTAGFLLVVIAETGRQPVDNPDTHLELTMIHEGALLEVGGRDLALLHWLTAARHWLVLVLTAQVFLPHPRDPWAQVLALPFVLVALCLGLALVETLVAKMRILLVPRLLGVGAAVALLGIISWLVENT